MRKQWLALLTVCASVQFPMHSADHHQAAESMSLRRIAEYWKEGEFATVKTQIKKFLAEHPQSQYVDSLHAMLGDLYFKEKNYALALQSYDLISSDQFLHKTQFNHLICLYDQQRYHDAAVCAEAFLKSGHGTKTQENMARFQMADSLYRLGKASDHPSAKEDLYTQALTHFKVLQQTEYADQTLYPSALMHAYLKQNAKAAEMYEMLALKYPEQKEAFLFEAATLLLDVDKDCAIEMYGKIYPLNGPLAGEAAFNQIQLLYEQKRYKDLLLVQEKAIKHIPLKHLNILRYYIGNSLVAIKDYQHAIAHFIQFLENKPTDPLLLKNTYLCLAACAKQTHDQALLDRSLKDLLHSFPKEKETAEVLLIHFQLCKNKQDFKNAQQDLKTLATLFPDHADQEALLYDQALLFCQANQWIDGSAAFKKFLTSYPNSLKKAQAYRHLIVCQIEEAKSSTAETKHVKKQSLIETLVISLGEKNIFSSEEKKQMRFLLGKTMYEIGQYADAISELEDFVFDYPHDPLSSKSELMLAHSSLEVGKGPQKFIEHAEKALAAGADVPKHLHLQLYNAYLMLARQAPEFEKTSHVDKAADHLYQCLNQEIKKENRCWLANHYFQHFQNASSDQKPVYLNRAIAALENVLGLKGQGFNLNVSAENLEQEAEAIKLCQLYTASERPSDAIALLTSLTREYKAHPEFSWKYRRLTLFQLGQIYEKIGDFKEAINNYDSLIQSALHVHSYFGTAALMQKTRLQYQLLPVENKNSLNPELQTICDQLKNLQIQCHLATEPWHLEAALTYIQIKTALAPEEEREALELQLLQRMEAFFSSEEDQTAQTYLAAAKQFPDQYDIYKGYIQFLKVEQHRLQALNSDDDLQESAQMYKDMLELPLHDLLKSRIVQRIEELKNL